MLLLVCLPASQPLQQSSSSSSSWCVAWRGSAPVAASAAATPLLCAVENNNCSGLDHAAWAPRQRNEEKGNSSLRKRNSSDLGNPAARCKVAENASIIPCFGRTAAKSFAGGKALRKKKRNHDSRRKRSEMSSVRCVTSEHSFSRSRFQRQR